MSVTPLNQVMREEEKDIHLIIRQIQLTVIKTRNLINGSIIIVINLIDAPPLSRTKWSMGICKKTSCPSKCYCQIAGLTLTRCGLVIADL